MSGERRTGAPLSFESADRTRGLDSEDPFGDDGPSPSATLVATRSAFRRRLLREVLGAEHEEVMTVQNGVEVMDRIDRDDYDVIVLDGELPIKDGFDTAAAIRDENESVGIVLLLEDDREETLAEAESVGVDEIVVRPFQADALRSACSIAASA